MTDPSNTVEERNKHIKNISQQYLAVCRLMYNTLDLTSEIMNFLAKEMKKEISPSKFNEKTMGKMIYCATRIVEAEQYIRRMINYVVVQITDENNIENFYEKWDEDVENLSNFFLNTPQFMFDTVLLMNNIYDIAGRIIYLLNRVSIAVEVADMMYKWGDIQYNTTKEFSDQLTEWEENGAEAIKKTMAKWHENE